MYKPGQGYWTRLMTAIGLALLVLMGCNWLWKILGTVQVGTIEPVYVQASAVFLVMAVVAALGYYLLASKPSVVDFMIATEGEMKKVNWSTRREIIGSTWVVIALTAFLAVLCFIFDAVFQALFQAMNVLETTTG
jgi:preprotein translocase subunit SecE